MSERSDMGDRPRRRQPSEGVRIIRADEAQAALDAGQAAGRRPDDELRFGDVPPAPSGPRPAHRFPLPDSVDPSEAVSLPPLATPRRREWSTYGDTPETPDVSPAAPGDLAEPGDEWDVGDRTAELGVPERPAFAPPPSAGEAGITVSGGGTDLPHWTDPPTGEVPRILPDEGMPGDLPDEDLEAWRALGSRGIRWRDAEDDWDEGDEIADLAGDEQPVGALDQSRSDQSDIYSFDEEFERVTSRTGSNPVVDFEEEFEPPTRERVTTTSARTRPSRATAIGADPRGVRPPGAAGRGSAEGSGGDDMGSRVVVGIGLVALLIIAYFIGPVALVVLTALVIVAAVAEAYGMLQRAGFRPATLLGLVATVGLVFAAYWRGLPALPLAMVLVFAGSMMWYVLGIVEARPLANVAVTTMTFVWVAVLGSYAPVMLRAHRGKGLFLGAILVAVAADTVAFVVGRWIGNRPMASTISPNKTVEGFLGGLVGALVVGAIVGKELSPWGGMKHGLVLGLIVGIIAPAGDLFESMIKRDLGVKDSGSILAGHGGLLDRFDSILLALPAAYYVALCFHLVK